MHIPLICVHNSLCVTVPTQLCIFLYLFMRYLLVRIILSPEILKLFTCAELLLIEFPVRFSSSLCATMTTSFRLQIFFYEFLCSCFSFNC